MVNSRRSNKKIHGKALECRFSFPTFSNRLGLLNDTFVYAIKHSLICSHSLAEKKNVSFQVLGLFVAEYQATVSSLKIAANQVIIFIQTLNFTFYLVKARADI